MGHHAIALVLHICIATSLIGGLPSSCSGVPAGAPCADLCPNCDKLHWLVFLSATQRGIGHFAACVLSRAL